MPVVEGPPPVLAGCCFLSGEASGEFLLTPYQMDPRRARGRAAISTRVLKELAEEVGCVRPETLDKAKGDLFIKEQEIADLQRELHAANAVIDALLVTCQGKMWSRAQKVRKIADLKGKRAWDSLKGFVDTGEVTDEDIRLIVESDIGEPVGV